MTEMSDGCRIGSVFDCVLNFYDLYCKFLSVVDVSPWLFLLIKDFMNAQIGLLEKYVFIFFLILYISQE